MIIKRAIGTLLVVFAGWIAVLAAVVWSTDVAPGAVVLFPQAGFVSALPDGVAVVGQGGWWIAVKGDVPGLGRAAYRAGGRLVLPAGLTGCLPLPQPGA